MLILYVIMKYFLCLLKYDENYEHNLIVCLTSTELNLKPLKLNIIYGQGNDSHSINIENYTKTEITKQMYNTISPIINESYYAKELIAYLHN